jgi:hypothetical protein
VQNKFEKLLVEHCAPTLAGIKPGNLFQYTAENAENINDIIGFWNNRLRDKGVSICLIKEKSTGGLIYVYRPGLLTTLLSDKSISSFLDKQGYATCYDTDTYISQLKDHICSSFSFPHEIGIFLGYPLHDVQGFIENNGKNFSLCGQWKVYEEPQLAERMFACYKSCVEFYKLMYNNGSGILKLTVAA